MDNKMALIVEKDIECTLSDGTILRADVYRPDRDQCYPVLMIRLPYDKKTPRYYDEYLDVPRMVQAGYVVILQDVRGRYASEGEFYPFIHEGRDGYESVEWAAGLPYANGKVGLFGMSYHGYTQLAAAAEAPPSLKAIAPVMTMAEPWKDMLSDGSGVNDIGNFMTWTLASVIPDQLERQGSANIEKAKDYIAALPQWLHDKPANTWLPMKELDPESFFFDVMNEQVESGYLERMSLSKKLKSTEIPALFMGGWFDGLLQPTLKAYHTYKGPSMLWIGPWTHEEMSGRAGDKFFENGAFNIGVDRVEDPTALHIKWFDKWLKDRPLNIDKPVHLYLAGQSKWESFEEWPPAVTKEKWFLGSKGASQTRHGDGQLVREPDSSSTVSQLKLDPENPVPTHGGNVLVAGQESGMFEQGDIQDREDVLVYTSAPLEADLDILGTISANIWVASKTPLADIFIRVSDVEPNNRVYNVVDTFHRESVEDDKPFCVKVDVNHTAYRFKAGHALRVEITASNAPRYDINLNNGKTTKTASKGKVAFEMIYHGGEFASNLVLPVTVSK
ncbi:putative CocE/NonD family hydrolase [Virgibacillus halotolerans]|uniref:CocE/NonD family hydrolase n=1 Tax=Virgibacillus halotolerans TaxID=1071053 RepID=UPI00195F8E5D|nr:CocE/NonD family hydrolase [Virgibacillus halotolerans]MBM7599653.1 putative CocE/NonD family hydrolase [Virgibacillus halotolerans]